MNSTFKYYLAWIGVTENFSFIADFTLIPYWKVISLKIEFTFNTKKIFSLNW